MQARHDEAVAAIAARVGYFYERKQAFRIYHGSTNSTRASQRRRDNTVDTSCLNRVLGLDLAKQTALVEPKVAMCVVRDNLSPLLHGRRSCIKRERFTHRIGRDTLVAATLSEGLVPLVVMEFPGITAGGGFSGTSGESSSFRYGAFDATINWIEMVLPNGQVATASRTRDDKTDLFWGAASAFGTLGVVTLLEVQLREAKPYVALTYSLHRDMAGANAKIQEEIGMKSVVNCQRP
jgi:Delta24-sterol reductase